MTIYFADIASYEAGLDMAGLLVVVAKATQGTSYTNPEFAAFHTEAGRHGTMFLAYHFLEHGNAAAQAAHAHQVAGAHPLMLDFEPTPESRPTMGDATAFIDAYRRAGGTCHLLYFPRWYWAELGGPPMAPLAGRGMILVSSSYGGYTDGPSGDGWQPYGGMTPLVWQYSSTTPFNRQRVDFNAFRGSFAGRQDPASVAACLAEFKALATTGRYPAGPAPVPALATPTRHVVEAGNTLPLTVIAERRKTTAARLAAYSYNYLNEGNAAVLRAYMTMDAALAAQGRPHPAAPAGLVWWSRNP